MDNQTGYTVYKSRMHDRVLTELRDDIEAEDVPVAISYDGDFGYIAVPARNIGAVEDYFEDMVLVRENADEGYVSSWMNIGKAGLARLNGEFEAQEFLEGRSKKTTAD